MQGASIMDLHKVVITAEKDKECQSSKYIMCIQLLEFDFFLFDSLHLLGMASDTKLLQKLRLDQLIGWYCYNPSAVHVL